MSSKYELTISTNYVPDWTYVEAIRELFQNALDNEIVNSDNKMSFEYNSENETLRVCNRTSVLELDSLLLGSTTKANDENTIGKHGEGYKIAFMVLLREGKQVKVYNYGKKEIWETALVKSRRYNNQLVPTVYVEKEAFWDRKPSHDLIIEVSGITKDEYDTIVSKNLNLQTDVKAYATKSEGRVLLDKKERGNLYVKGLYICRNNTLEYGYDFEPSMISLDRDRKLLQSFDVQWQTCLIWKDAFAHEFMTDEVIDMIKRRAADVCYMQNRTLTSDVYVEDRLSDRLADDFIATHEENSVPVRNNTELRQACSDGYKPVLVSDTEAYYISQSDKVSKVPEAKTLKQEFQEFMDSIESKLTDEEIETFSKLIEKL